MQTTSMRMRLLSVCASFTLACTANADKRPVAPGPVAPGPVVPGKSPGARMDSSPDARGRAVLNAQLAALTNDEAFIGTFAKQATVLTPLGRSACTERERGHGDCVLEPARRN